MISLKNSGRVVDRKLLVISLILTILGLLAVADASVPQAINTFGDKFYFFKQQLIWAAVGVFLMIVFSHIKYTFWKKFAQPLFVISIILLILVLVPSLAIKTYGARRWLSLGPLRFQPSEIVKFTLALYFARLAESKKKIMAYFIPVGIVAFLIMLEPDLGTAIIVVTIALSQMFVSGINLFYFTGVILVGAISSTLLIWTSAYRRARLITFFETAQDPLGKSYHIRQILFSLGLGNIFGVGLGASRQKYLFLPEASTDSIFAVIAEEVGFIGSVFLIFIFIYFIYRAFKISYYAPDVFSKMLALGLTVWIGSQILLNICSMLALVPLTGIPLPFFSYGGTSLMMTLSATGILLNISRYVEKPTRNKKRG